MACRSSAAVIQKALTGHYRAEHLFVLDAKLFCRSFIDWYNRDHHHAGIGLMTPDQVHYGQADAVHDARQKILDLAYVANPERFVKKSPNPPNKPTAVWINPRVQKLELKGDIRA